MDKLLKAASAVAGQVFTEFINRGGVVRDGERKLSAEQIVAADGALAALLWWLHEFLHDYQIDFPEARFEASAKALLGLEVTALETSSSASPGIFMLADFLRNEVLPEGMRDLDLSVLFQNFRAWAEEHVVGYQAPATVARKPDDHRRPD